MTGTFNVLECPWKCGNCHPPGSPLCLAQTLVQSRGGSLALSSAAPREEQGPEIRA